VAENISISFLSSPCVLEARAPNSAEQYHLLHGEVRHVFTPAFWPKVLSEPVCGAIIISHLRALNEGLHHLNKREGIIIILEGDIIPRNNSLGLFLHFLAQILGNPHLQHTLYTALTFSEWHPGYAKKVHEEARQPIPGTKRGAYFSMCSVPVQSEQVGNYQFIGQGGRALAYRSTWAEHLKSQQVSMFWDIWIINQLSHQCAFGKNATGM